jgi:SET domain-containing protein
MPPRPRYDATDDPPLTIRDSPIHGRGGFATARIPAGTLLIEYAGERIGAAEARRRAAAHAGDAHAPHTFVFAIDDDWAVDAGVGGNDARWLNHSCAPNCDAIVEDGRIWIETARVVAPGEELTYDYQLALDEPHTAAAKARYPCRCGAATCRGTMLAHRRRAR